jgi:hypothetical protein
MRNGGHVTLSDDPPLVFFAPPAATPRANSSTAQQHRAVVIKRDTTFISCYHSPGCHAARALPARRSKTIAYDLSMAADGEGSDEGRFVGTTEAATAGDYGSKPRGCRRGASGHLHPG